eukprot:265611-Prymnesium_polylepis.1
MQPRIPTHPRLSSTRRSTRLCSRCARSEPHTIKCLMCTFPDRGFFVTFAHALRMLLFLHTKGAEAPIASALALGGQVVYFWGRVFTGKPYPWPCTPMGALPRYVALGMLLYSVAMNI